MPNEPQQPPTMLTPPPSPTVDHLHSYPLARRTADLRIPAFDKFSYCLCLHVKPTTIFIAVLKLVQALLIVWFLVSGGMIISEQGLEMSLTGPEDCWRSTVATIHVLSRIIMAAVSAVGIYAVVSGRAALLMPMYAMLLCEFFFSLSAMYSREPDFTEGSGLDDFKTQQLGPHSQYARYSLALLATITMIVKIYFLCVVWKCYRLLRLRELELKICSTFLSDRHPQIPDPIVRMLVGMDGQQSGIGAAQTAAPPPYECVESNTKPPNYEEAMKSPNIFTINIPNPEDRADDPQQSPQV